MQFSLESVPGWAHTWCYVFAATAFLAIFSGFAALFAGKKLGTGLVLLYLLSALIQAATMMTLFWMCRTSLGSTEAMCGARPTY